MKDRKDLPRPTLSLWSAPLNPSRQGITLEPDPADEPATFAPVLMAPGVYGTTTPLFSGRRVYFAVGDGDIIDVRVQRDGESENDVIAAIWRDNDDAIEAAKSSAARSGLRLVRGGLVS